jgi:hypothetical protein
MEKIPHVNRIPYETKLSGIVETLPPFYQYQILTPTSSLATLFSNQISFGHSLATESCPTVLIPNEGPEIEIIFQQHYGKEHPKFNAHYPNLEYDHLWGHILHLARKNCQSDI